MVGEHETAPWPDGWSRPHLRGRFWPGLAGVVGALLFLLWLVLVGGLAADPAAADEGLLLGSTFLLGTALLAGGVGIGLRPAGEGGPRLVEIGPSRGDGPPGTGEWGLAFDYSGSRFLGTVAGLVGIALIGLLLALAWRDTGAAWLGWPLCVFLALPLVIALTQRLRGVVLTTERLVVRRGRGEESVAWDDVVTVFAYEQRAQRAVNRFIGIRTTAPAAIAGRNRLQAWIGRVSRRRHGPDIALPAAGLAVSPARLVATAQRFARDPAARERIGLGPTPT